MVFQGYVPLLVFLVEAFICLVFPSAVGVRCTWTFRSSCGNQQLEDHLVFQLSFICIVNWGQLTQIESLLTDDQTSGLSGRRPRNIGTWMLQSPFFLLARPLQELSRFSIPIALTNMKVKVQLANKFPHITRTC